MIIRVLSLTSPIGIDEIASLKFIQMLINCHIVVNRNYQLDKYIPPNFIYHLVGRKRQNTKTFPNFGWIKYILVAMIKEICRCVDMLVLRWIMRTELEDCLVGKLLSVQV